MPPPPSPSIPDATAENISRSVLGLADAVNRVGSSIQDAQSFVATGRMGLAMAEPLQKIADEVISVAKRQAIFEARAQLRAGGQKLDPETRGRIGDAFDVVADALKEGTDNAADRAARVLDVQLEFAQQSRRAGSKQVVEQIKNAQKLLSSQRKATVGFLGEMVEDFRQGPLADFVTKLESNYLGKLFVRFTRDRIAAARADADARTVAEAKLAEERRKEIISEQTRKEAIFRLEESTASFEANSVKSRLETEKMLLDKQREAGAPIDETRYQSIVSQLDEVEKLIADRQETMVQRDKLDKQYEELIRQADVAKLEYARVELEKRRSDLITGKATADEVAEAQAQYDKMLATKEGAAAAEKLKNLQEQRKLQFAAIQTQNQEIQQASQETSRLTVARFESEADEDYEKRVKVETLQRRNVATREASQEMADEVLPNSEEAAKLFEQIGQSFANNVSLTLADISAKTSSGDLVNERLVKDLAQQNISKEIFTDRDTNEMRSRWIAGPGTPPEFGGMGGGAGGLGGAGMGLEGMGGSLLSDIYNMLATDLLFLKDSSAISREQLIVAAETQKLMLQYLQALVEFFASGPVNVSGTVRVSRYADGGTGAARSSLSQKTGQINTERFDAALEKQEAATPAAVSRMSARDADFLAQKLPDLFSPEAIANSRKGVPGMIERQDLMDTKEKELRTIISGGDEKAKSSGFANTAEVQQYLEMLSAQKDAELAQWAKESELDEETKAAAEKTAEETETTNKDGLGVSSPGWLSHIKDYTFDLMKKTQDVATNTMEMVQYFTGKTTPTPTPAAEAAKEATKDVTTDGLVTATETTPTPAAEAAKEAAGEAKARVGGLANPVAGPGGIAISINLSNQVSGIIGGIQEKTMGFAKGIQDKIQSVTGKAGDIVGSLKDKSMKFASDIGAKILGPKEKAADTELKTAEAKEGATAEGAKAEQKPDSKFGFVTKLFGGGMFDKIKGALAAFKGGLAAGLKGIGEGLKSIFDALAEGLKKMGDPAVIQGALALLIISGALLVFAAAMWVFGKVNWMGALIGILVFVAFATLFAVASTLLAKVAPLMYIAAGALLAMTLPLIVFAVAVWILGNALKQFAEAGFTGMFIALSFLTALALLGPTLLIGSIFLALASFGFLVFGLALVSLGLGMMMFANTALSTLPVVIGLLAALAVVAFVFQAAIPFLAAMGGALLMFGVSLIALGLGMQMFAGVGLSLLPVVFLLLAGLALISVALSPAVPFIEAAAVALLFMGVGLIALGLGLQMVGEGLRSFGSVGFGDIIGIAGGLVLLGFAALPLALLSPFMLLAGTALAAFGIGLTVLGDGIRSFGANAANLPLIALGLMLLGFAALPFALAAPFLLLGGLAMIAFGYGLTMLGRGIQAFGDSASQMPAIAFGLLLLMGAAVPLAFIGGLLLVGSVGLLAFGYALQVVAQGMQAFAGVTGSGILAAILTLGALAYLSPLLMVAGYMLLLATPGWLGFGIALIAIGFAMSLFAKSVDGLGPALATLAALALLGPMLAFSGIGLLMAAPGLMAFGVALAVLGGGLMVFALALQMLSTALQGLAEVVLWIPLIGLGIALMVLMLLPLVLPMLIVASSLALFAFALMAYVTAIKMLGFGQQQMPALAQGEQQIIYNVGQMQIENLPLSFPKFEITNQGGAAAQSEEMGSTIANAINQVFAPVLFSGGGDGGGASAMAAVPIRNGENTFRRVQERFYYTAIV
jgi:hypothetical protein